MNNKGFAITGILYTIFTLFMLILSAILANISFKRSTLSLSTTELEDDFSLVEIENLNDGYIKDATGTYSAKYDGKYIFLLTYIEKEEGTTNTVTCSTYLKKGENIPLENIKASGVNNPAENFTLIPADCNNYQYKTFFENPLEPDNTINKLQLQQIYKFKGSD